MENKQKFLNELTILSEKYNIQIGGCGCCGSPFIYPIDDECEEEVGADNLTYSKTDGYTCD